MEGSAEPLALPKDTIDRVVFYKRVELTTDLIFCEVRCGGTVHFAHEEMSGWRDMIAVLEQLPRFAKQWFEHVAHPAFERPEIVAFESV